MSVAFCVVFVFMSLYLFEHLTKHGKTETNTFNFWKALFNAGIEILLFLWVAHWSIR